MRIWDIDPGYLNRQSLLGEHRELHGIVAIIVGGKKGYSRHPETLRWSGYGWALRQRHRLLASEMNLRGYHDRSPVLTRSEPGVWPKAYLDPPSRQLRILVEKYREKEPGRLPLPLSAQQLWSQHKYSVLARDPASYRRLGKMAAGLGSGRDFSGLAEELIALLRRPPSPGALRNALQHMWGHVADIGPRPSGGMEDWTSGRLLEEIRRRALPGPEPYLVSSTALGELGAWLPPRRPPKPPGRGAKESD